MKKAIKRDLKERGKPENIAKKDFLKSWNIYHEKFKNKNIKINSKEFIFTEGTDVDQILKQIF